MTRTQEITLTRTIHASPAGVYAAFTSAAGWCAWRCETAEADPQVGGRLHIYTEGYNAYGEFTAVKESKIVAFTWDGDEEPPTRIHVSLEGDDSSTSTTFRVTGLCSEQEWASLADFLEHTWGRALDNLKAVLEAAIET